MPQVLAILLFFFALGSGACREAPLLPQDVSPTLNNPVSMVLVPDTDLAIVANANIYLSQNQGSLLAVNVVTRERLPDTLTPIPNFAGKMALDTTRTPYRLYVPVRSQNALLVFDVTYADGSVEFSPVDVPAPAETTTNGVEMDDNPFDAYLARGVPYGDSVLVSNILDGSVSFVPQETLVPPDLDAEHSDRKGLPLFSAANFGRRNQKPGKGADRLVPTPDGKLLYVGSTLTNDVYVLNVARRSVEAMLSFSSLTSGPGIRGIAIDHGDRAYFASRGLGGVVVADVRNVTDNGIDYEVVEPPIAGILPTGRGPEALALTPPDEKILWVTDMLDDVVLRIELSTGSILTRTNVGSYPAEFVVDEAHGAVYVLNFLSSDISILDLTDGHLVGTIR